MDLLVVGIIAVVMVLSVVVIAALVLIGIPILCIMALRESEEELRSTPQDPTVANQNNKGGVGFLISQQRKGNFPSASYPDLYHHK